MTKYGCIVDALFGTGLSREITGEAERAIGWCNEKRQSGAYVIAVDIPSGIHSGTGQILGCAVHADKTVTFSRYKTGLCLYPGREYAGQIDLQEIGIPQENPIEAMGQKYLFEREDAVQSLPPRQIDSHKGTYGKVLVTAGATRERLDPVRFLSNDSSGKMGFAIAAAARDRGADVMVVCGITQVEPPTGVRVIRVESTQELYDAVTAEAKLADVVIQAAAPADYRFAVRHDQKLKKQDGMPFMVELVENPDIAAAVGSAKRPGQVLVGFAAETEHLMENAAKKLQKKNLDMIVANDVSKPGAGFNVDTNIATLLTRQGATECPLQSKAALAQEILNKIDELRHA